MIDILMFITVFVEYHKGGPLENLWGGGGKYQKNIRTMQN